VDPDVDCWTAACVAVADVVVLSEDELDVVAAEDELEVVAAELELAGVAELVALVSGVVVAA
jgi:hypothetical protein